MGSTETVRSTSANTQLNLQAQLHMHAIFYCCQLSMKAVRNNDHFSIFFFLRKACEEEEESSKSTCCYFY